ncbi:MAG: serine/threonine-protein kinase, partial [Deltaproteobacteria bacterium]
VSLSNIMIGYEGGVKLIDFGIAKSAKRVTKTVGGTLKGKFGYLSPEQVLRQPVDHRTDIFALGIVLYELTTMERAFIGSSELITLERITKAEYTRPSRIVAHYPQALEAIIERALDVDPDRRFQSAGEMARELEAVARAMGEVIGDSAIIGAMRAFGRTGLTKSQRFARASSRVRTDPELMARIEAEARRKEREDLTPVVPTMLPPMTGMPPLPPILPEATPTDLPDVPELVEDDLTVPISSTPNKGSPTIGQLGMQYASALRPPSGTAKVVIHTYRGLWIALALIAIMAGVIIALAVR